MPGMDTAMDTVLEYLESISDMDNLSNNFENSQQLIEDLDIITDWINDLLDLRLESETLTESLQDGVILCQLTSALSSTARLAGAPSPPPPGIRRYHKKCRPESIQARDNVSSFSLWCMLYEVPPVLILSADDVVMGRNTASIISLLLYLVRKSSDFSPTLLSRKSSTSSSTGSYYDRVNRRSFSRKTSIGDCFHEVMNNRKNFRNRSLSVDSEGSLCSSSGSARSPVTSNETSEAETLIRDLNLACRNISKKIVVANVDIPGCNGQEQLRIDKALEDESQASLRRKSRLFKRSNTVGHLDASSVKSHQNGKRRFVLKNPSKKADDLDISGEKLSLEDMEYLLLSTADNVSTKIKAVYKLIALRALENQSRSSVKRALDCTTDITASVYPYFTFTTHTSKERESAFRTLKTFLISNISDSKDVLFGDVYELWNRRYS
ncbi:hypothetical protein ACHWQZ_G008573 [Mnemiopsis leidyi]